MTNARVEGRCRPIARARKGFNGLALQFGAVWGTLCGLTRQGRC